MRPIERKRYRVEVTYRGRFAPSPTGLLHLGSAATALFCAAAARRARGLLVLRVEDIDTPRVVAGMEARLVDDLAWLGVRFDEGPDGGPAGPYRQSERFPLYEAALDELARGGHTYLCDCSRADIARVASAPHVGDEGPAYPGTCRPHGMKARSFKRPPAVRLRVPDGDASYRDGVSGVVSSPATGDFVLRRGDGVFAYQLATLVDDLAMDVTEVVRGRDLVSSAPRQALLARLLGRAAPVYTHVPLLVGPGGARLAKRSGGVTIAEHRERGVAPERLVRAIARGYGHDLDEHGDPLESLSKKFDAARFPGESVSVLDITGFD